MSKKYTFEQFVEKANIVHNKIYIYPESVYKNNNTKMEIICQKHGSFWQRFINHVNNKSGCPECKKEKLSFLKMKSVDKFILESIVVHNNKYDYSLIQYLGTDIKVKIICKEHGIFEQSPHNHLEGQGCRKCRGIKLSKMFLRSTEEFIKKAITVHNDRYDYSESVYLGRSKKIKILCSNHGFFYQVSADHLDGHGCDKCCKRISNKEIEWLNQNNILIENRQKYIPILGHKWKVDGFNPETNTIYEFLGDYWHRKSC